MMLEELRGVHRDVENLWVMVDRCRCVVGVNWMIGPGRVGSGEEGDG